MKSDPTKEIFEVLKPFRLEAVPTTVETDEGTVVRYEPKEYSIDDTINAAELGAFQKDLLDAKCIRKAG